VKNELDIRERLMASKLLQRLSPAIEVAAPGTGNIYLVGGAVRDLLLDRTPKDIDLAVEGNALEFARRLAAELELPVKEHERFQTAIVSGDVGGQELTIDVAETRTESYAHPGALPDVQSAGLLDDLRRRDFTINAMAIAISGSDAGTLHDPFSGSADLASRSVRVLHDASFADDPTRLIRAVRYESRLGFEIESQTLELFRGAIEAQALSDFASARVRDELVDLLLEPTLPSALVRMHELGLDRALHPHLSADPQARALIESIDRVLEASGLVERVAASDVRLAALGTSIDSGELAAWLDRLDFAAERRDLIVEASQVGPSLGQELGRAQELKPSQLQSLLVGKGAETLLLAAASSTKAAERIASYVDEIEPVALEIDGHDLIAQGIPEGRGIGAALQETLARKLDGELAGRDQELAAAMRILTTGPGAQ